MKIRFLLPLLILLPVFAGFRIGESPGEQMQTFAVTFLGTLDDSQKSLAMQSFDSQDRVGWHFIPKDERKGLMLGDMNDAQQTATLRLLRSALSQTGYFKTQRIMQLEEVLNELESGKGRWERNPQRYFVTIFGDPAPAGTDQPSRWGLSFEGHHLSLNFVCRDGKVVDSTPQFLAANPAVVMTDTTVTLGKGTAVLAEEEQLGFALVRALDEEQLAVAKLADDAPAELRFAGEPQATLSPAEGISFDELNDAQQRQLRKLIDLYFDVAPESIAQQRREQVEQDGWDNVHFAWAGALQPGVGHYYRIQGQRFLIEFVNSQADPLGNPANHIHCVLRDLTGDFDLPIE